MGTSDDSGECRSCGRLISVLFIIAALADAQGVNSLSIRLNFTGASQLESGVSPPDTMAAVGTGHIVELLNGNYSVFRKSDGELLKSSSLDQFWINAGASLAQGRTTDPRVLYDRASQRWFASTLDINLSGGDLLLLAVSTGSDPTLGWTGFTIPFNNPINNKGDFPTLGINRDGVFLHSNGAVIVVPKNDLLQVPPTVAHATLLTSRDLLTPAGGGVQQPVVDLDGVGLPEALLTVFDIAGTSFKSASITGTIASPSLDTSGGLIPVAPFQGLGNVGAVQPGSTDTIFTGSQRFNSSLVRRNRVIWGVECVANSGRAALRWFALNAAASAVLQEGLIADPDRDFYMGSIAVNDFDDVVIGFTVSSDLEYASSYAVLGTTVSGRTTFGDPLILQRGIDDAPVIGGAPTARWGDYSATVVDPTDPFIFWTVQEWMLYGGNWTTQITQLHVEAPCAPDVTNQFRVVRGGFQFDNATQHFFQTVTLQSLTASPVTRLPLSLVLDNLSPNATLVNKTGSTTCFPQDGSAYINVPAGSNSVTLEFNDPGKKEITYNTRVEAGPGAR